MEFVDILTPPIFNKTGETKPRQLAWQEGDWIGTFNLWIVRDNPEPAIIYQIRSQQSSWAPGKLDATAAGHYQAGETIKDGLREVKEELGVSYDFNNLTPLGRKLHVSPDENGNTRHNVVDIFFIKDNRQLKEYKLEKNEVHAIGAAPIQELIKVHQTDDYQFNLSIITNTKNTQIIKVTRKSFPFNWDNYHYKIALLAKRFINGETPLIY